MGHHDDRCCRPIPKAEQLKVESFASQRIESAERLVKEQDRRFQCQGAGQRHALTGPSGQLGRAGGADRRIQTDEIGKDSEARQPSGQRPSGQLQWVRDVVGRGAPRQETRLLEDEADTRVRTSDLETVEERRAGVRSEQPGDDPQERGLAASVGADQGDDPTTRDRQVDTVEHGQRRTIPTRLRCTIPRREPEAEVHQSERPRPPIDQAHGMVSTSGRRRGAVAG